MIGEIIRKLRIKKGYTLVELEKKSGVSYVQISRYEKGKSKPTSKIIKKIAKALNVETNVLIEYEAQEIKDKVLFKQFKDLMEALKSNNEDKFALSKIFEAMLFREKTKRNLIK